MIYNIGVDVSGGDYAPKEIIKGAILAKQEFGQEITLIGVKEEIESELAVCKGRIEDFTVVNASEKIEMGESPATSVRRKKDSSLVIGTELMKKQQIHAFVSCGNTGAVVCAATLKMGLIKGIERPGIGLLMPTAKDVALVMDVGANIDPRPVQLLHYAVMAAEYSTVVLKKNSPTVGLLNIGEEESKGSEFIKNTYKLLSACSLNFIGNIEPKDIFTGRCDCAICDGLIGNITLKVAEATADFVGKSLVEAVKKDFLGFMGLLLMKNSLIKFKKRFHYAEYGGAPLLGIDGIVIIGHGRSNALAVKNAIKVAVQEAKHDLNTQIRRRIDEVCQDSGVRQVPAG